MSLAERRAREAELRSLLDRLDDTWRDSESSFDTDPLTHSSPVRRAQSVPLRPSQEENWSHWLAHLLRSSDGRLLQRLLETPIECQPRSVRREAYLRDPAGTDRRVDVVVEYVDRAITVEVKKWDEHYAKTRHTAALAERGDPREWTHLLLVPERKRPAVRATFGADISEDDWDRPVVRSSYSSDILLVSWEEVSREIRRTLLDDGPVDELWDASAYLFVATIEQSLLNFQPIPSADDREEGTPPTTEPSDLRLGESERADRLRRNHRRFHHQ